MTDTSADQRTIEADGCEIVARAWGEDDRPAIVLVHGSAAHLGWWEPIAADLATDHRVVALDLSGHGDSGWRDHYTGTTWADEVNAVIDAFDAEPALIVGHSLGARVSVVAAGRQPERVRGLMLVDPPVRPPDPDGSARPPFRAPAGPRTFATLDEAKMSFHLRPHEPILNHERLFEVAAASFKQTDDGWAYKADTRIHERIDDLPLAEPLANIPCPLLIVWGAMSPLYSFSDPDYAVQAHAGETEIQTIRDAYHHLMFDHGPELTDRIRAFSARCPAAG
jgi:pimeloyl-ACP methyl ester carboxylesterase